MSGKLNALKALFAFAVLAVIVSTATAQTSRGNAQGRRNTIRAAVVAIKRDDRLQLAGEKERLIAAMQTALNSTREGGVVTDIKILSFEKASYLAVLIEKQGTLYLPLEPSGDGFAGIYYVGDEKYLYCASGGCSSCKLVMTGQNVLTGQTGPRCECDAVTNQGPTTKCELRPRLYVNKLVASFNDELLAIGFEEANPSANEPEKTNKGAMPALEVSPGRPGPIKRPNK
ncbi:MAG: hypothetical protein ICV60_03040 [Pyrinomonadaceae bacterium]|nr:hypothetical protein [Pyrinomonadaceae bacterium]